MPKDKNQEKNKSIQEAIDRTHTDIIGMTETNLRWNKLPQQHQWIERTKGVWESSHHTIGHNTRDIGQSEFQPGGCITLSLGSACHRAESKGIDPTKLGRWTWTRYKGINGITLRVITAYRPCNITGAGPSTVHSQHQRYLDTKDDHRTPREAMLTDLLSEISTWRDNGEQIILLMDCNEDVRNRRFKQKMLNAGLTEAITNDNERLTCPTHSRGSTPIDGIFISHTIHPRASGYLPFGEFPSDHRAIWIDISHENAFGSNTLKTVRPRARKLKSNDPKVRNKFIKDYENHLRQHKAIPKLYDLQNRMTLPLRREDSSELEAIFKIRHEGIKLAEAKCRKLRMGAVPYSEEFRLASKRIELWRAVDSKKKGSKYSMTKLRRLEKILKIHNCLNLTSTEIKLNIKEAYKNYWTVKKEAKQHRLNFLERKAQDIANESGLVTENVYKQLMMRENQRLAARRIKYTLKKLREGSVTRIEIPVGNDQWQEITTKKGIEKGCISENIKKYRQTESTPCMIQPLRNELGFLGNTPAAEAILRGTYTFPQEVSQFSKELLQEFKRIDPLSVPPPESIMSTQDFIEGWKKMREQTSSGKSGLHFGHMKACTFSPTLSNFEATISHIPYTTGYVPNDWKKGVCCMIKKKANINKVTKLRTIVLTEADYNFSNKKLGRDSIRHAEANDLIAPEQYGSRRGKSAIEHALNKRISYDLLRQLRCPGALCSNDAKSCYDRIIHSIVSLAFQRLGIPKAPVHCMLECIHHMKHYIRTSFGDSDDFFTSEHLRVPFQGILQGNGAAPTIWVLVSTPLLNMLRTAMNGAHLISPISAESSHIVGYAFVDDTDLITMDMRDTHREADGIMIEMQNSIDRWEGGLWTTGGAIVPEKSWVYPIDFKFDGTGKWKYKSVNEIDAHFSVKDQSQQRINLSQVEPTEGRCTLGVILAPDGNNEDAIQDLRLKSEAWRDHIRSGHLSSSEARLATQSTIMKSLEYPLLALTITDKECKRIMTPVLEASLTKSHVNRNFPRSVVYGPTNEKGLGMKNLYTTKGLTQISAIVQYITDNDNITGKLLRTSIELAKMELGTGRNIFTCNYWKYEALMTESWIKSVWKFMWEKGISLRERCTKNITRKRENDALIMEDILNEGNFSRTELQHINRCRIHLQVSTLSDITTGDGNHFSTLAYKCEFDETIPHKYIWPKQTRPGQHSRRLWKKALKLAYPSVGMYLIHKVGRWTDYIGRKDWIWFYNHRTQIIYQRHERTWKAFRRVSRAGQLGYRPRFRYHNQALSLPPFSWRATVIRHANNTVTLTGSCQDIPQRREPTEEEEVEYSVARIRELLKEDHEYVLVTKEEIIEGLRNNSVKLVSDGSFDKSIELGTAAWVIAIDRQSYLIGRHWTPGEAPTQCAHRSELSGILGAVLHINQLCYEAQITTGTIELKCDGKSAVEIVNYLHQTTNPSRKHFDVIESINEALKRSPLTWTFNHVYGHQDGNTDVSSLDDWAFFNVIADTKAKDKLKTIVATVPHWPDNRPTSIPYKKCTVYSTDESGKQFKVGSNLRQTVYNQIHTRDIREYWVKKGQIQLASKREIDWEVSAKGSNMLGNERKKWLSKWVSGICGVGKQLKLWKWQHHSKCPRCLQDNETVQHVTRCKHADATLVWHNSIGELREWLKDHNGEPDFSTTICDALLAWHDGRTLTIPQTSGNTLIQSATRSQNRIGWQGVINGFLSIKWRLVQEEHLIRTKSTRPAILWMALFQRRIWMIPWAMWEHRNQFLHQQKVLHPTEISALNSEISLEWATGIGDLPQNRYSHLFHGNLLNRLKDTPHFKQLWLASVWAARDLASRNQQQTPPRVRNDLTTEFYNRWKESLQND